MPRLYVVSPPPTEGLWQLPEEVACHVRVLRLRKKDPLVLFCGDGYEYPAILQEVTPKNVHVVMQASCLVNRESPIWVGLAQSLVNSEKMEFILQKGVEMGVSAFQPLITERSLLKVSQERLLSKLTRWQRIIQAACEQCGRNHIPLLYRVESFEKWIAHTDFMGVKFILQPSGTFLPRTLLSDKLWIMVGPEGGFSDSEEILAQKKGWQGICLGPRILRTETAGLAAAAAIQTLWGDIANTPPDA